jgi:hypothetical protein
MLQSLIISDTPDDILIQTFSDLPKSAPLAWVIHKQQTSALQQFTGARYSTADPSIAMNAMPLI